MSLSTASGETSAPLDAREFHGHVHDLGRAMALAFGGGPLNGKAKIYVDGGHKSTID